MSDQRRKKRKRRVDDERSDRDIQAAANEFIKWKIELAELIMEGLNDKGQKVIREVQFTHNWFSFLQFESTEMKGFDDLCRRIYKRDI